MQNSELYRRGIVLPLDMDAEDRLRANDVSATTEVRILEIPCEGLFESLWRLGLFQEINARCETMIDDYEEEIIEASSSESVIAAIDSIVRNSDALQPDVVKFFQGLRTLAQEAYVLSRPLLFVL